MRTSSGMKLDDVRIAPRIPSYDESVVGLPPNADEHRHAWPALQDQQQQGGHAKSKLDVGKGKAQSVFRPEVLEAARQNYAKFYDVDVSTVDEAAVGATSLGVAGWSDPRTVVRDYDSIDDEREARGCCAFGDLHEVDDVGEHNSQVTRLLEVLGGFGAGRRAVLKAIAEQQGITDPDEVERLYEGKSEKKLVVPAQMRPTLQNMGLGEALAPVNILTLAEPEAILNIGSGWKIWSLRLRSTRGRWCTSALLRTALVTSWTSHRAADEARSSSWATAARSRIWDKVG